MSEVKSTRSHRTPGLVAGLAADPRSARRGNSSSASPPHRSIASRILAGVISIVPGLGHVLLTRHIKGSAYFVLFWTALNGAFLNFALDDRGDLQLYWKLLLATAGLIWLTAFTDLAVTLILSRRLHPEERNARFLAASGHYLRGELPEAKALLSRLLARNPADSAAALHLASVYRKQGHLRKARRMLRHCHRHDRARKWEYEVLSQLQKLDLEKNTSRA